MIRWSEVSADKRYTGASPNTQSKIRDTWYEQNVKSRPGYRPELDAKARKFIFGSDYIPKTTTIKEVGKGILRSAENIAGSLGAVTQWAGEALEERGATRGVPRYMPARKSYLRGREMERKTGKKIAEWGKVAYDFWRREAQRGIEAPDPEVFRGTFMQNPSWTRAAATIAEAVPSLAAATAITFATKSPIAGAASLGLLEGSEQYVEARRKGKSVKFSSVTGGLSTVGTTVLEILPLTRFLRGGSKKLTKDIFIGAAQEGGEEVLQALWQNAIAKIGYDKTRDLTQGMVEGFIAGAGSGGLLGGITSGRGRQLDTLIQEAQSKGIDTETMQESLKNQVVANASKIEDNLERQPKTQFGKQIKAQILFEEQIPLHPAAQGREEMAKLTASRPAKIRAERQMVLERQPKTQFGKQIRAQMLAKEQIPLHPAEAGREALSKLMDSRPTKVRAERQMVLEDFTKKPLVSSKIEVTKDVGEKGTISKELQPLADEARKAKTAEEFKNAIRRISKREGELTKTEEELRSKMVTTATGESPLLEAYGKRFGDFNETYVDFYSQVRGTERKGKEYPRMLPKGEVVVRAGESGTKVEAPKPVTKYAAISDYHVRVQTSSGIQSTLMSGAELNEIATSLESGLKPKASWGEQIERIDSTIPVKGQAGMAAILDLDTAVTAVHGKAVEASAMFKHDVKKWGVPALMGDFYPPFKEIYQATRDVTSYGSELNFSGQHVLRAKESLKLPAGSQQKVVDALRLGDMQNREVDEEELRTAFGFDDREVRSFKSIRRTRDFSTELSIKAMKVIGNYDSLPDEVDVKASRDAFLKHLEELRARLTKPGLDNVQAGVIEERIVKTKEDIDRLVSKEDADKAIKKRIKVREGQIPQTRLGGKWAVYKRFEDPNSPNFPYFFNLYPDESSAKQAAKAIGGDKSNYYLRQEHDPKHLGRMNIVDLEALVDSAGVDQDSSDIKAVAKEIQKRTFAVRWTRRMDVPGYEWTMANVLKSISGDLNGASSRLARAVGWRGANRAYVKNLGKMSPEIKAYSTDYMNNYFNTGAIGMPRLQKLFYLWEIALKVSQLAQNLSQPLSTTLSSMMKYYSIVEGSKVFLKSYTLAGRFAMYKITGKRHGLSTELLWYLNKLDRRGQLGQQMVRYMMDSRTPTQATFEKVTGSLMQLGEFVNRTHASIVGRFIATDKIGLKDKNAILVSGNDFNDETQVAYGKHNLPTVITGAGNAANFFRLMFTFRMYPISNLARIMKLSPTRGAGWRPWTVAATAGLAMHGWKGTIFLGLLALLWKKATGRTLEYDIRKNMQNLGASDFQIDLAEFGLPSLNDMDVSLLVGSADLWPTWGTGLEKVVGAPAGFVRRMSRGLFFAMRGDYDRATEEVSPGALRNVLKMRRQAIEGVRNADGSLIAYPSARDNVLRGMGFMPKRISKKYGEIEAVKALKEKRREITSKFHRTLAWAKYTENRADERRIKDERRAYNRTAPRELRIIYSSEALASWRDKFRGKRRESSRIRRKVEDIKRVFGVTE